MFRGLLVLLLGIFFIKITEKGQDFSKSIPIFGEPLQKLLKNNREYMIVYLLALSQILL